jgi:hypothetical protein
MSPDPVCPHWLNYLAHSAGYKATIEPKIKAEAAKLANKCLDNHFRAVEREVDRSLADAYFDVRGLLNETLKARTF